MSALPKDFRLKKRSDFYNLYKSGAAAYKTRHFTFLVKPNTNCNARFGVVIRKKIIKQSVCRNYIRRVANALFFKEACALSTVDIIAILTKPIELNFSIIKHDWDILLDKIKLRENL